MYQKYQPKSLEELKKEWATDPRWIGVKRPYSAEDVDNLRGTFQHDHTLARMGSERLWNLLHDEKYIHALGVPQIRAHAADLTAKLRKELPRLGYPCLTPEGNETPIISFRTPDYGAAAAKLKKAFPDTVVALRKWEFTGPSGEVKIIPGMRISPSVYNSQADVDRLLEALS